MPITIVIPCFNEARRLEPEAFLRFANENPRARFLFVDDGSSDDTAEILARVSARHTSLRCYSLSSNSGKAEAVRQGILAALAEPCSYVGYWDADLSTPLSAIQTFVDVLDRNPHVLAVLGSRVKLLGRTVERSAARHYIGRVFATAASLTLKLAVYDTQCGAKLFRVCNETAAIFCEPFLSRWIFDVEIIARLLRGDSCSTRLHVDAIVEVPLERWVDVGDSRVRLSDYVCAGIELFRIWRRYGGAMKGDDGKEDRVTKTIMSYHGSRQ